MRWLAVAGWLSGAGLAGCRAEVDRLEWTVANDTADTLRVSVRYPLDSTWLATPDQLGRVRQRWTEDSSAMGGRGYYYWPLRRLVCHHGRWYLADSRVAGVDGTQFTAAGALRGYEIDRAQGLLTYNLPPHSTQRLLAEGYQLGQDIPVACMSGLWLQQGSTRQQVLPGRPLEHVFKWGRTDRTHTSYNIHHLQLTVGPGLTVNNLFWRWWVWRWWY